MPIDEAVRLFIESLIGAARSPHTINFYGSDLRRFAAYLARMDPAAFADVRTISARTLRAWLGDRAARALKRRKEPSKSSIARAVYALRAFFRFLLKRGVLTVSPAAELQAPRVPPPLRVPLSVEQATRLVEAPKWGEPTSRAARLRDRAILEVLWGSGLRAGELAALDIDAIDLPGREARVVGKGRAGGEQRVVPLTNHSVRAITSWLRARSVQHPNPTDPAAVFLSRTGRRLQVHDVEDIVARWGRAIGLRHLHPHLLRHTASSHMLMGGANLRVIQLVLGHARITTTARYTHPSPQWLRDSYDRAHPLAKTRSKKSPGTKREAS